MCLPLFTLKDISEALRVNYKQQQCNSRIPMVYFRCDDNLTENKTKMTLQDLTHIMKTNKKHRFKEVLLMMSRKRGMLGIPKLSA